LDNPASEMILPIIALAEAIDIVHKGRTRIPTFSDLLNEVGLLTRDPDIVTSALVAIVW